MLGEVDKDEENMRKMKSFFDEMLRLTESWKTVKKIQYCEKLKGKTK